MNSFNPSQTKALALQNIWDTLSDVFGKYLSFSLIKIEPVSINQAKLRFACSSSLLYILFY
jgi:hypothetical protein